MNLTFAEDMMNVELEPSSFTVEGEVRYTVKGMHQALLGGVASKYAGEVDDKVRGQVVDALVCAVVTERDPAEALQFLIASGVDAPVSFVGAIVEAVDYLDEYQLLHPPDLAVRRETEHGTEYEITERN